MYNPRNHYWLRQDGTVYSSARQADVPADDADYLAWLAAGGVATRYPNDEHGEESAAELAAVLAAYGLLAYPDPNADIDAQILALEGTVTQRRLREAALTEAGKAWLADVDAQIATLRKGLVYS